MEQLISNLQSFVPEELRAWLTMEQAVDGTTALAILVFGWVLARIVAGSVSRVVGARVSAQAGMVTRLVVYYTLLALVVALALGRLGFDVSVLLGAAGILTVAIGFAAQTSASNLISGVFLIGERPFVVGDIIRIGQTEGEVMSMDPMSVKLRTYDNVLVRMPNESLLKSEIVNLTHFPIRRVDVQLRVEHDVDVSHVRRVLGRVADEHPLCLDEPRPEVWFKEFELDGMWLQFSLWTATPNFFALRNHVRDRVMAALVEEGIGLATPVRTVKSAHGDGFLAE
ncbi:MAG: mechanosensitive ion channel [Myxococcales bacterium]|nr:mechanosensitive ion channel [Myxococcales bacterium]